MAGTSDIPRSAVKSLVSAFLGEDVGLADVVQVCIGVDAVTVTLLAKDNDGQAFAESGSLAVHTVIRRVV